MDAFVYGTLCDPDLTREVLGHANFGSDVRLVGLRRVEGRYPTLAPGGETVGRVLRLTDGDLDVLDRYEGVDRDLYVRVRIPGDDGGLWTYVGDPDVLGVSIEWPSDGSLRERIERYVESSGVYLER